MHTQPVSEYQQMTAIFTNDINTNRRKSQKLLASLDDNSNTFLNEWVCSWCQLMIATTRSKRSCASTSKPNYGSSTSTPDVMQCSTAWHKSNQTHSISWVFRSDTLPYDAVQCCMVPHSILHHFRCNMTQYATRHRTTKNQLDSTNRACGQFGYALTVFALK